MECFWNLRGVPIPRPLQACAKPGFESEWTSQLRGRNAGASPDTEVIPASLSSPPLPLTLHPPLPNRRQPRSQPRVSDLSSGHSRGCCREPWALLAHSADPGCRLRGWSSGLRGAAGLPCPCPLSPSLGTANADLELLSWPPDLGLSLPLATWCPALLMNFPGGSGPSLCPDLQGPGLSHRHGQSGLPRPTW